MLLCLLEKRILIKLENIAHLPKQLVALNETKEKFAGRGHLA